MMQTTEMNDAYTHKTGHARHNGHEHGAQAIMTDWIGGPVKAMHSIRAEVLKGQSHRPANGKTTQSQTVVERTCVMCTPVGEYKPDKRFPPSHFLAGLLTGSPYIVQ